MSECPLFLVDAFTDTPFHGNPAAVCIRSTEPDPGWMQNVAAEMNLSETAFVFPGDDGLQLRWYTPAVEVDLCGHATLAAAHTLRELLQAEQLPEGFAPPTSGTTWQFASHSGTLTATVTDDGVTLDFPALPSQRFETAPEALYAALGVTADDVRYCGRSQYDVLLELGSAKTVRRLRPDMTRLSEVDARGVIVTAAGDQHQHDFVSRFFAPVAGVNEDPVTGSAHCVLAPYWSEQFGRHILFGYQASVRGGYVRMELRGDRVLLSGQAVTVMRGTLLC